MNPRKPATADKGPRQPVSPRLKVRTLTAVAQWWPENEERYDCLDLSSVHVPGVELYGVEVRGSRLTSVFLDGAGIEASMLVDCRLDDCSLANVRAHESSMIRVAVARSRLTGISWSAGGIRDVTFEGCKMNLAGFRMQKFSTVVFVDCDLRDSDFQGADLRGARFERCDLTNVEFSNADLTGAWFQDCSFERLRGAMAMKGATIGGNDLISLSPAMASAIGITVREG